MIVLTQMAMTDLHPAQDPQAKAPSKPLTGLLVVALEQAVAAPYCSSRLADAGARVIKIERPEGDFARGYDRHVHGESTYFVWINRGKESVALDLKQPQDLAVLERMIVGADVFLQNLAPGAAARLGLGSATLRERHPRLITCDISGYGEHGTQQEMKAYDLLVQAESGLISVSGASGEWGRIGVSLCDITAGMNALIGIQQALLQRALTGVGSGVHVSLFDSAAELMSVPYLQAHYGGRAPERVGLHHALWGVHLRRWPRAGHLHSERARVGRVLPPSAQAPRSAARPPLRRQRCTLRQPRICRWWGG